MKRMVSALFLALAAFMAGCSAYRSFSYSSPDGKTCLTKCENTRWTCRSRCGSDTVCLDDCEDAAKTCRKNCPEISVMEPETTY
jgi:hypothetical protein